MNAVAKPLTEEQIAAVMREVARLALDAKADLRRWGWYNVTVVGGSLPVHVSLAIEPPDDPDDADAKG